jgi:hypothetical protein
MDRDGNRRLILGLTSKPTIMAFEVRSTGAGYNAGKAISTIDVGSVPVAVVPDLLTASAMLTLPYDPILRTQRMFAAPGAPGQNVVYFYNTQTGVNDLRFTVYSSNASATAWRVLNEDSSSAWYSPVSYNAAGAYVGTQTEGGDWIRLSYPYMVCIKNYFLYLPIGSYATNQFKRYKLLGSRDFGATWEMMDDKTGADLTWGGNVQAATLAAQVAIKQYSDVKLVITKNIANQTQAMCSGFHCYGCQKAPGNYVAS